MSHASEEVWCCPDPTVMPDGFECVLLALPVGNPDGVLDDLLHSLSRRTVAVLDGAPPLALCLAWVIPDADRLNALLGHDYLTGVWCNAYPLGGAAAWKRQGRAAQSEADALRKLDDRLSALLMQPDHRTMLAGDTLTLLTYTKHISCDRRHFVLLTQSAHDPERWHGEDWLAAAIADL